MSTLSISDVNNEADIDAYMAEQGEASGEAIAPHSSVAPQITLNGGVAPTDSTPSVAQFTPVQKLEHIRQLCSAPLQVGDTWYVISRRWYKRWEKACSGVVDKEGPLEEKDLDPVDNTALVDMRGNIVSSVIEHVDVEFVPQEAWDLFVKWCVSRP